MSEDTPLPTAGQISLRLYSAEGTHRDISVEDCISKQQNTFIGWKCSAGVNNLFIDHNGTVYGAECGSIGQFGKNGNYGNVFESFKTETEWVNCAKRFCNSRYDLSVPRYKKTSSRELLALTDDRYANPVQDTSEEFNPLAMERLDHSYQKQIVWELLHDHTSFRSVELLKLAVENLEIYCKGESLHFNFIKCDPTDHPYFLHWSEYLAAKGHTLVTPTTGRRPPEYYAQLIHFSDIKVLVGETQGEDELLEVLSSLTREIFLRKKNRQDIGQLEVVLTLMKGNKRRISSLVRKINAIPFFSEHGVLTLVEISEASEKVKELIAPSNKVHRSKEEVSHRVLCFIPMKNCQSTIARVIEKVGGELTNYISEVLVIDNDSRDDSLILAKKFLDSVSSVKTTLLKNHLNYGFGESHKIAFKYAHDHGYDYLMIVHGDDSGDPREFLPVFKDMDFIKYDMILSDRLSSESRRVDYPFYRLWANRILNFLATLITFKKINDFSSGPLNLYRISTFVNKFENPIARFSGFISFPQYMLLYGVHRRAKVTFRPIEYREAGGKSFYSAVTQFVKSFWLLVRFAIAPSASLKVVPKIMRSGQLYKEIKIKY